MDRYLNTEAIVIKSQTSQESDLTVTLLTPKDGKIIAVAKGAKNIRSSRLGGLQLGNSIKVHLFHHSNGRYWISENTTITQFLHHAKNLTQINLLFYFLEILNLLIAEEQQIDGIYEIAQNIIRSIDQNKLAHFIYYEIRFIDNIGFGLPIEITQSYEKKDYSLCQNMIKKHLESIIEKPINSNKLFS